LDRRDRVAPIGRSSGRVSGPEIDLRHNTEGGDHSMAKKKAAKKKKK